MHRLTVLDEKMAAIVRMLDEHREHLGLLQKSEKEQYGLVKAYVIKLKKNQSTARKESFVTFLRKNSISSKDSDPAKLTTLQAMFEDLVMGQVGSYNLYSKGHLKTWSPYGKKATVSPL